MQLVIFVGNAIRSKRLPILTAALAALVVAAGYTVQRGSDPGSASTSPDILNQSPLTANNRCEAIIDTRTGRPGSSTPDFSALGIDPTDPLAAPRPGQMAGQAAPGIANGCPVPLLDTRNNDYPSHPSAFGSRPNSSASVGNTAGGGVAGIAGGGASGAAGGGGSATTGGIR